MLYFWKASNFEGWDSGFHKSLQNWSLRCFDVTTTAACIFLVFTKKKISPKKTLWEIFRKRALCSFAKKDSSLFAETKYPNDFLIKKKNAYKTGPCVFCRFRKQQENLGKFGGKKSGPSVAWQELRSLVVLSMIGSWRPRSLVEIGWLGLQKCEPRVEKAVILVKSILVSEDWLSPVLECVSCFLPIDLFLEKNIHWRSSNMCTLD